MTPYDWNKFEPCEKFNNQHIIKWMFFKTMTISMSLVQKWGAIQQFKSLWDFMNEISSLHCKNLTLVKIITL